MLPTEMILGMGGKVDKQEWWRGEFKYDIFYILQELL
jgi:hypothetical protein